jgi:hypothetical protein
VGGILFGQSNRSFLSKEVIARAGSGTGAVHRELRRLAASGLLTVRSVGWKKHYQANRQSPVFEELRGLVMKTVGLVEPTWEHFRGPQRTRGVSVTVRASQWTVDRVTATAVIHK